MVYPILLRPVFPKFLFAKIGGSYSFRNIHVQASRLVLEEFGDPKKVVKKEHFSIDPSNLKSDEVRIGNTHNLRHVLTFLNFRSSLR